MKGQYGNVDMDDILFFLREMKFYQKCKLNMISSKQSNYFKKSIPNDFDI